VRTTAPTGSSLKASLVPAPTQPDLLQRGGGLLAAAPGQLRDHPRSGPSDVVNVIVPPSTTRPSATGSWSTTWSSRTSSLWTAGSSSTMKPAAVSC
jgi:hypothetical protein